MQMYLYCKENKSGQHSELFFTLLMAISMIIWGGSWVSAKVMAVRLPPEVLCFWRFLLSFISLIPFVIYRKPDLTAAGFQYSILGAFSMSAYMYYFFMGLQHQLAGAAGVLVTSMIPLMTLLLSLLLLNKKAGNRDLAGLILGMIGAAILLRLWTFDLYVLFHSDNLIFVLCAALWAVLTICSQRAGETISPYLFSVIAFGLSTLFFLPSALSNGIADVFSQDMLFWANLIFLSVISAGFATTVYFVATKRLGAYRTSSYVFLVPTSAVLLSLLFLGEVPQPATIIGGTIAISAVYLINSSSSKKNSSIKKADVGGY
jgi:drug/metabolite transporter (DMT)-like permease